MALTPLYRPAQAYRDGYWPTTGLQLTVGALPSYPLAGEGVQIPDNYAVELARDYLINPLNYRPRLGARTSYSNLLLYSADPTESVWTKTEVTPAASTTPNPVTGELDCTTLLETTTLAGHTIRQDIALPASSHVAYAIVRGRGRSHAFMRFTRTGGNYVQIVFPLTTGARLSILEVGSSSGDGSVISLGDDWWLLSILLTVCGPSSTLTLGCSDGSTSYTGDTTKGLEVYTLGVAPYTSDTTIKAIVPTLGTARSVSVPDIDPDDPFAFLCAESDPQRLNSDQATLTRRFRRVPKNQIRYDAQAWQRPEVPGESVALGALAEYRLFGTSYVFFRTDKTLQQWQAYTRKPVTSDTGIPSFYPSGGTYTLSFAGATTTALNYNDAAATVETALNGLASITARGGCTVTGSYNSAGGFAITFANYAQITIASGSLTGSGTLSEIETLLNNGYAQSVGAYYVSPYYVPTADASGLTVGPGLLSVVVNANFPSPRTSYLQIYGATITGGTYTITLNGATTSAIPYTASAAEIQAAINALGVGTYTVSGGLTTIVNWVQIYITTANDAPTGGTYTLTVGADTTGSINYNDDAAAVQTALNALTSVTNRGGCTVTGSLANGWGISFANPALTTDASSLTPSGSSATPSVVDSPIGRNHALTFSASTSTRTLYVPNHGITATSTIFVNSGTSYYFPLVGSAFSVVDANTIRLNVSGGDSWASFGTMSYVGSFNRNYAPGPAIFRAQILSEYYLPGYTMLPDGTTCDTAAQIPPGEPPLNDTRFLEAVLSGAESVVLTSGPIQSYLGPMLVRETTSLFIPA